MPHFTKTAEPIIVWTVSGDIQDLRSESPRLGYVKTLAFRDRRSACPKKKTLKPLGIGPRIFSNVKETGREFTSAELSRTSLN
jgi:hypothetical protein